MAMIPDGKGGGVELEAALARDEENPRAKEGQPNRGDLNGAYQEWLEGGSPNIDSDHPLSKSLLAEITRYAWRDTVGFVEGNNKNFHLTTNEGKNNLNVRAARAKVNRERLTQNKIARAKRALPSYDRGHPAGASFVTYLRKPFDHAEVDELRRVMKPSFQEELRAYYGSQLDDEIDREPDLEILTGEPVHPERYLPENLRPLAHWIGRQPDGLRITWRTVARAFPDDFGSEDKAQRALRAIRDWFDRSSYGKFRGRR